MAQRGMRNRADLMRATGISDPTARQYMTGQPGRKNAALPEAPRQDTIYPMAQALHWSVDWWDRIASGDEPMTWEAELDKVEAELDQARMHMDDSPSNRQADDVRFWERRVAEVRRRNGISGSGSFDNNASSETTERLDEIERRLSDALRRIGKLEAAMNTSAINEQFAAAANSGDEPGEIPPTTQIARGGRAE